MANQVMMATIIIDHQLQMKFDFLFGGCFCSGVMSLFNTKVGKMYDFRVIHLVCLNMYLSTLAYIIQLQLDFYYSGRYLSPFVIGISTMLVVFGCRTALSSGVHH
jgi:hypothetical protein